MEENPPGRLSKKTGIHRRHIAAADETPLDMAQKAIEQLFSKGIDRTHIEFLLFCTQTPDYILPTSACILQDRLGLSKSCGALDFNLGCSGYVYGLSLAKGLIESGQVRNVLLVTAEAYSKHITATDTSNRSLFGDAATATFIEQDPDHSGIEQFVFGTDGSRYDKLIVKSGGARHPRHTEPTSLTQASSLYMDGPAISEFALEVVPQVVETILANCNLQKNAIDYYVFHQANKFMLEFIKSKCELLDLPVWNYMAEYGNTVSNTIPIALADLVKHTDAKQLKKVMLIGFGVGLSWAGCLVNLEKMNS